MASLGQKELTRDFVFEHRSASIIANLQHEIQLWIKLFVKFSATLFVFHVDNYQIC